MTSEAKAYRPFYKLDLSIWD